MGPIKALSVMAPGREGMVQLHFYALAEEYDRYLPLFNASIDSFAFEPGYSYSWAAAVTKSVAPRGRRISERGVVGALMGALVALFALRRRQRAKTMK